MGKKVTYDWVKWRRKGEWVSNDEGYYWQYCSVEGKKTEHERGECLSCWNKGVAKTR